MLQPPVVLHSGMAEQQLNGLRRKLQPGEQNKDFTMQCGVKRPFREVLENLVCCTWRDQVLVGAAIGSEDLDTSQCGHLAGLDYQLHRLQLTCVTEPHPWEELQL